ncbi:MAG: RrF2 family transcriptional regulator [Verrucomicrobiales bacterium]
MSKKAEYALRAVIAMGRRGVTKPVQIQDLSRSERIPVKFLEHILLALKKANLLRSKRGAGGGYQLNKKAEDISLGEVLEAIDGPFLPSSCLEVGQPGRCGCGQFKPCGMGTLLGELQHQVTSFLYSKSIADAIAREHQATPNFDI